MIDISTKKYSSTFVLLFAFLFLSKFALSQSYYWVAFSDKNNSKFSISEPEKYLSERAIQRRIKQNIAIDSLDLPVVANYIDQVIELDAELVHASKWLNGITVKTNADSFKIDALQLSFVKEIQLTKPAEENKNAFNKFYEPADNSAYNFNIDTALYGPSAVQVEQLNAHVLHGENFKGQGIHIAVLDGGFLNVDEYTAFDSLRSDNRILGTKDFVDPGVEFYETHYHGMSVLSCMAGNIPGELIGTAPKASYWLIRSEDTDSEYLIEEDNWVVAAEFADSVGVDVINSSLGYSLFNDESMNHTYAEMDGNTTRVTKAANIAVSKGMLVFSSAGNEGNDPWKFLIAPADGDNVIAVGAVNNEGEAASFTSFGPASDGDIKPNVAAMGRNTYLQKSDGTLGYSNGTSFASPVLAGAGACLWQANPDASAAEVKLAIEQSGHLYPQSDSLLGYGIPDMQIANQLLKSSTVQIISLEKKWLVYPNPAKDYLVLYNNNIDSNEKITVSIYTLSGRLLRKEINPASAKIIMRNLQSLPSGLLILKIDSGEYSESIKFSKIR